MNPWEMTLGEYLMKDEPARGRAIRAWRKNPITVDDLKKSRGDKSQSELLAERIPGAVISHSKSTNSSYVRIPGGGEIRFSDHTKYGRNIPTDLCAHGSFARRAHDIDRALRAAFANARNYREVPSWADMPAKRVVRDSDFGMKWHRESVERAIIDGHVILERVLADYPDLRAKYF